MTTRLLIAFLALNAVTLLGGLRPEYLPPDSRDSAIRALRNEIARLIAPPDNSAK